MPSVSSTNNTQSFYSIHWPVWGIRSHEYISKGLIKDRAGIRRLDLEDKSDSFPIRRLKAQKLSAYKVYPLKKSIWNFKDLLKSGMLCFVDYNGKVYKYQKSKFYPLVYKKITSRRYTNTTTIFNIKGINSVFEVNGKLNLEAEYAGLINIGRGYLLYEVTNKLLKTSKRKI
jgi:hypothetical protein